MNQNFKKIFNDAELKDYEFVKSYILQSFKYKRAFKCHGLYINMCKIYDQYPKIITDVLDKISQLGYYKDYFLVMYHSRNDSLTSYIINSVQQQITVDLNNLKHNKPISTLGKWLPREESYINKRINFIDKFCALMFPHIDNKFKARKSYRIMKVNFNKQLGTIESKLCTKKYSEIDFEKVSPFALNMHKYTIQKHEECKSEYDKQHIKRLSKMDLNNFMKEIITNKDTYDANVINEMWNLNSRRFISEIPFINKLLVQNPVCIVDLSNDTFLSGLLYVVYGLTMLVQTYSKTNGSIVIASKNPKKMNGLNDSFYDNIQKIIKYCGPSGNVDMNSYIEFLNKNGYQENCIVILITGKDVDIQTKSNNVLYCKLDNNIMNKKMDLIYWDTSIIRKIEYTPVKNITKTKPRDVIKKIFHDNPRPFYSKHKKTLLFVLFLMITFCGIYYFM